MTTFEQEFIALSKHNDVRVMCASVNDQVRIVFTHANEDVCSIKAAARKVWGPTYNGTLREIGTLEANKFTSTQQLVAAPSLPGAIYAPTEPSASTTSLSATSTSTPTTTTLPPTTTPPTTTTTTSTPLKRKADDRNDDAPTVAVASAPNKETAVQRARRRNAIRAEEAARAAASEKQQRDQLLLRSITQYLNAFMLPYVAQVAREIYRCALDAAPADAARVEWVVKNFTVNDIVEFFGTPQGRSEHDAPRSFIQNGRVSTFDHPTRGRVSDVLLFVEYALTKVKPPSGLEIILSEDSSVMPIYPLMVRAREIPCADTDDANSDV